MRPIWSGALAFGLVTIPVKVFSATESKNEVRFRLLDEETLSPIKEVRIDPKTGKEVPWERIVHGVEYARGKYLALDDKDLKSLPLPTANTVDIFGFVDAGEVDPLFYDRPYFLGPDKGAAKAYELLRQTLEHEKKLALGKVTLRNREHLVEVRPEERALVMVTLHYADEVRNPAGVPGLDGKVQIQENERRMAVQLVRSMAVPFAPAEYKSEYKQALNKLIKAKVEGKDLPPSTRPSAQVIDLQRALRESLQQVKHGPDKRRRRIA
jgi:DNA end-binding protein Ku